VPLELLLDHVRVLQHGGQPLLAQHGDDGSPALPRQADLSHVFLASLSTARLPAAIRPISACDPRNSIIMDYRGVRVVRVVG
jgi:hypothetical protein